MLQGRRQVLGKHIWAGKSYDKILHIGFCLGCTKAVQLKQKPSHQPLNWQGQGWLGATASHSCPGLPKTNQALGTPGHGWSSWFLGGRLGSSGLQQGGSEGQGARPGAITARPNHPVPSLVPQPQAKQTQQQQLAQPESCSRVSKTQQTHP